MLFPKIILGALLSTTCVSAFPDMTQYARDVRAEIYEQDLKEMGLARPEDHPDPEMVSREVEAIVRKSIPDLFRRIELDCSTLVPYCTRHMQCKTKSNDGCGGCNLETNLCQKDPFIPMEYGRLEAKSGDRNAA